jgi:hypothetical protein
VVENGRIKTMDEEKILEELLNREGEVREKIRELVKHLKV